VIRRAAVGFGLGAAFLAGAARADEAAIDRFLNFASNGCVGVIVGEAPVAEFAQLNAAPAADAGTATAVLGKDEGQVFLRPDPAAPLAIAAVEGKP
jgi:hypothetical protein